MTRTKYCCTPSQTLRTYVWSPRVVARARSIVYGAYIVIGVQAIGPHHVASANNSMLDGLNGAFAVYNSDSAVRLVPPAAMPLLWHAVTSGHGVQVPRRL